MPLRFEKKCRVLGGNLRIDKLRSIDNFFRNTSQNDYGNGTDSYGSYVILIQYK